MSFLVKDKYKDAFFDMVKTISKLSYCKRKQVGALIVKNNNVISFGYNGTVTGSKNCCEDENNKTLDTVIHAEENSILNCAKNGISVNNSSIFITCSPCMKCARMIIQSGIKEVYFIEEYKDGISLDYLEENNIKVIKKI